MGLEHYGEGGDWHLDENESVTGTTSQGPKTIYGPKPVRVTEYPDLGEHGKMQVQYSEIKIMLDGLDFPSCVTKSE